MNNRVLFWGEVRTIREREKEGQSERERRREIKQEGGVQKKKESSQWKDRVGVNKKVFVATPEGIKGRKDQEGRGWLS